MAGRPGEKEEVPIRVWFLCLLFSTKFTEVMIVNEVLVDWVLFQNLIRPENFLVPFMLAQEPQLHRIVQLQLSLILFFIAITKYYAP